jgi:hypothetical protein
MMLDRVRLARNYLATCTISMGVLPRQEREKMKIHFEISRKVLNYTVGLDTIKSSCTTFEYVYVSMTADDIYRYGTDN